MRIRRLLWAALAANLAMNACSSGGSGSGSGSDDDDDDGAIANPLFQADIVPILNATCGASNNTCHSRVAYAANPSTVGGACRGWLSLENTPLGSQIYDGMNAGDPTGCPDRSLYDRLTASGLSNAWQCGPNVFVPSEPTPTVPYVVPGDADASYLFRKINGGPYCGNPSDPMPQVGVLPPETIETIRNWIDTGAPQ